jgi:hypothetical protein
MAARAHQASKAFAKETRAGSQRKAKEPLQETTGYASREPIVVTEFRSDVPR